MTQIASVDQIVEKFKIAQLELGIEQYRGNFNAAPTQQLAVVTETESGRALDTYKWGLIPFWADDPKIGYKMINARCETVAEKPSFKKLLTSRRCIIPADGFYEWKGEKGSKQPYYIHMKDGSVFGFAGLWTAWRPKGSDDEWTRTCTVITTSANELMQPIHNRMPVILDEESAEAWLNPDNAETDQLLTLLRPFRSDVMEAYEVSTSVNKVSNNSPDLVKPSCDDHPEPEQRVMNSS